jgi:hypothetical protein
MSVDLMAKYRCLNRSFQREQKGEESQHKNNTEHLPVRPLGSGSMRKMETHGSKLLAMATLFTLVHGLPLGVGGYAEHGSLCFYFTLFFKMAGMINNQY